MFSRASVRRLARERMLPTGFLNGSVPSTADLLMHTVSQAISTSLFWMRMGLDTSLPGIRLTLASGWALVISLHSAPRPT